MDKNIIEQYYRDGIFTEKELDIFVLSGDITEADKQRITEVS